MAYIYLALAILAEVIATSALKSSQSFTQLGPSFVVVIGYGVAFYLLSLCLNTIPLGIAYAIWSALGIVLISLVGIFLYHQSLDWAAWLGMSFIIIGVIILNVFSQASGHGA